jgi:hypothetical protein
MVKTIKCTVGLERIRSVVTEFIRKLPSYDNVTSTSLDVDMRGDDRVGMTIKWPTDEECYECDGTGKFLGGVCHQCDGTGKDYEQVTAWLEKDEKKPGQLKIRVFTSGVDMSIWKPDVERVRQFIEGLVGQPCIVIPMSKKQQLANQPPVEDQLQASIDKIKNST